MTKKPVFQIRIGLRPDPHPFDTPLLAAEQARLTSLREREPVRVFDAPWPGGTLIQSFHLGKPTLDQTPAVVKSALIKDERDSKSNLPPSKPVVSAPRPVWAQRKPGVIEA